MSNRQQADITHVEKKGEGYLIKGISKGKKAAFYIDAPSLDKMSRTEADNFMRRNIHNLTRQEE